MEDILDHRMRDGKIEYFVKWKGYPEEENTWEKESQFEETECIADYWNKQTAVNLIIANEDINDDIEVHKFEHK